MQGMARISSSFREMPGGAPLQIRETPGGTSGSARLCGPKGAPGIASPYGSEGGVPIVPPRGIRPFDGRFWQRCRRPGRSCGLRRRFCAHLFTVLESRPGSAQHSVVSPPVEMTQSAAPRGLAELQAMRRTIAAEVHRRLVSDCNGHGKWQVLASGGYWRGAGAGTPEQGPSR